jgi:pyrroline-5-carboxylate reductase
VSLAELGPVVLIGAGKMGLAMARGWIAGGLPADRLVLVDPQPSDDAARFAEIAGLQLLDSPIGTLTHISCLRSSRRYCRT